MVHLSFVNVQLPLIHYVVVANGVRQTPTQPGFMPSLFI
jgi:hypothetical protein